MSHQPDERELFRCLGDDTHRTQLAAPEELRRRSDRRTAARAAVGTVAVVVAVGGVLVGGNALSGTAARDGQPAESSTPTVSESIHSTPPPTSAPAPPSTGGEPSPEVSSEAPSTAIPEAAWLNESDLGFGSAGVDPLEPPVLCDQPLVPPGLVDAGALPASGTRPGNYHQPGTPEFNTPDGTIIQSIVLADGEQSADVLMDSIQAAVARCPEETTLDDPSQVTYTLADGELPTSSARPDRHLLIDVSTSYERYPEIAPAGVDRYDTFISVLQVGDAVTILEVRGWEASDTRLDEVRRLARLATVRLLDWRS